jgi:hypothetical protein
MDAITTKRVIKNSPRAEHEAREIPAPASITVELDRRPVLFMPDGTALVNPIGFRNSMRRTDR